MFSWDLTQGRPGHSAVSSLQSSHPSQHNVDLQRPREELGDSSDISPQLSCLAASQAGLVVARTDQQQLVCLVLPDVWPVMSDVCHMGTGSVWSMSYEARSVSHLSVPLLSSRQSGGAGDGRDWKQKGGEEVVRYYSNFCPAL